MNSELLPHDWHGLWRSVGYNRILEIDSSGYALYSATMRHARPAERGSPQDFAQAFDRVQLNAGGRLALFHAHDVTRYEFERCVDWPAACRLHRAPCLDPRANLEAFCELFAENYAFFDLRRVDWPKTCELGRARLKRAPAAEALLDIFEEMTEPLADIHVHVSAPGRGIRSMRGTRGPREALRAAFDLPAPQLSRRATVERVAAGMRGMLLADFATTLRSFRQAGNAVVSWGMLRPGIGYLNLLRMFGFASTDAARQADDLPHPLSQAGSFMAADMASLDQVLEQAMCDLAPCGALIVDARLNGGGFDRAGLLLCERLIEAPQSVYRKKARAGAGFTSAQSITLTPSRGTRFTRPVFLLTSAFTQSAGEVLALAMSQLPHVRLLGERTQGILSDNLFHRLPNDWEVSLSNEVYETLDGRCFEAAGVPPDEPLPALGATDLLADLRAGLRMAVERAVAA